MRRQLRLKNSKQQISQEIIDSLQEELGIIILKPLSDFLIQNNGGDIDSQNSMFFKGKYSVRFFLGICDNDFSLKNTFLSVSELFEDSKKWLPFAFDDGDWIYCICLKKDRYGQIYLMRTDETEEDEAFVFVCNSFDEFIDGLQPEEPQA